MVEGRGGMWKDLPESLWGSEAVIKHVGCIEETTLYIVPDLYPESGATDGGWYGLAGRLHQIAVK